MSREAWGLFAAMSVIWGIPYLLIKVAVTELDPAAVAGSRTLLATLVLLPLAIRRGAIWPALRLWPWVAAGPGCSWGTPRPGSPADSPG
jgi:drug/metabolite transporter (DMT)-like permease